MAKNENFSIHWDLILFSIITATLDTLEHGINVIYKKIESNWKPESNKKNGGLGGVKSRRERLSIRNNKSFRCVSVSGYACVFVTFNHITIFTVNFDDLRLNKLKDVILISLSPKILNLCQRILRDFFNVCFYDPCKNGTTTIVIDVKCKIELLCVSSNYLEVIKHRRKK